MGTYFPPLNLTLDADERAVKRAYAALLKETRPEDDPVAFQALVDARDRALDWVRRRAERSDLGALGDVLRASPEPVASETPPGSTCATQEAAAPKALAVDGVVADEVSDEDAERVLREILAHVDDHPAPPPLPIDPPPRVIETDIAGFRAAASQRSDLILDAIDLIGREGDLREADSEAAWTQLLASGEDLDLAGRLALERAIVLTLDAVLLERAEEEDPAARFARTILKLDRAFRWSDDMRRVVRILSEPAGTHPLVFAIERFGERAVRLRTSPSGFPIIPDSDLSAWFGKATHAGLKAYRRSQARDRLELGWSWYALLSPPSFLVSIGANLTGMLLTVGLIATLYFYFDPIANVWMADGFVTFLAFILALRVGFALAARSLEIGSLVRRIRRVEANGLPQIAERRKQIAAGRGPSLLNMTLGLAFLLLIDGYWLSLVFPALQLSDKMVAEMIVIPDRKTPGVTFADRLTAESYIDSAREIARGIDELVHDAGSSKGNAIALARAVALKESFLARIARLPIGDYAQDFERYREAIAAAKRRSPNLVTPGSANP